MVPDFKDLFWILILAGVVIGLTLGGSGLAAGGGAVTTYYYVPGSDADPYWTAGDTTATNGTATLALAAFTQRFINAFTITTDQFTNRSIDPTRALSYWRYASTFNPEPPPLGFDAWVASRT